MTTDWRSWLPTLCDPDTPRKHTHKPWYGPGLDGEIWTIATNGRGLIYVRGRHCDNESDAALASLWSFMKATPPIATTALAVAALASLWSFMKATPPIATTALAALREWLGPVTPRPPCSKCQGLSAKVKEVRCSWCKGEGLDGWADVRRPGYLVGVRVDRNLLARFVERLPDGKVVIGCYPGSDSTVVVIDMAEPRCRVIAMGMIGDDTVPPAPRFPAV